MKKTVWKWYPFIGAFMCMCLYLLPKGSMCTISGDAADIWQTIKSFGHEDMHGSYVLYKGILSVYPYVWLYRLAMLLHTDEWLFIKLFYCLAFAYITAKALPDTYELLSGQKTVHFRRFVLVFVCFYFWRYNLALSQMMVDLPCLMLFLFLVNAALRIYKYGMNWKRGLCAGAGLGLNLGGSGQYTAPAVCVCIFLGIVIIRQFFVMENNRTRIAVMIKYLAVLIIPAAAVKLYNSYFLNVFVEGLRRKGAWIPDSMDWLSIGFSRFMNIYRTGGTQIPSNLNQAIFQKHLGYDAFEQMKETILSGGYGMRMTEYIRMVLHDPISFGFCYLEKLFLILSPDGGVFRFLPLFIFYTLFFITISVVVSRCRTFKEIINVKFWIIAAFIWSIAFVFVGVVEQRYAMQVQGLILAVAVCDSYIWNVIGQFWEKVKNRHRYVPGDMRIPYVFLLYCVFIVSCFLHMSGLYELIGVNANEIMMRFV